MDHFLFKQSFLTDSLESHSEPSDVNFVSPNGTVFKLLRNGVLEVIPADFHPGTSKSIVISCGIHGNETAPIELVNKLVSDIESEHITLSHRCLFIIANIEAIKQNKRYIDENLNRLFDETPREDTKEHLLAESLKYLVQEYWNDTPIESRWHFDLHCAIRDSKHTTFAISPKSRYAVRDKALFDVLELGNIEAVVLSNAPSSTFSWYTASTLAVKSVTVELGRIGRFGENDLAKLAAFSSALTMLLANEKINVEHTNTPIYRVSRSIIRMHEDFKFLFDQDVANFTSFIHGEVFGHDGDKPLMAKNDGEAVIFPNTHVAIGERAALMVCLVNGRFEQGQLVYD
ncbi:succinylglutamate desuccinylase [Vibrio sp. RC27]